MAAVMATTRIDRRAFAAVDMARRRWPPAPGSRARYRITRMAVIHRTHMTAPHLGRVL
jgi:hypothetical protein